jgi:GNAT superfamily N-acetyltransferase
MGQVISRIILGSPKSTTALIPLPDALSRNLGLSHPTDDENTSIWELTAEAWKDALTVPQYLEESVYLVTIPLAKDGGMTQWILVDTTLPPNTRLILASCETFRKRSLISDPEGNVTQTLTHGIASLFVAPELQRRGYATRLLKELRSVLPGWQAEKTRPVTGSVLFSDIGKQFYTDRGWRTFPSYHLELSAEAGEWQGSTPVLADQVGRLCEEDEAMIQRVMSRPQSSPNTRFIILPDHDHMLWHHRKEEFVARKLFGKEPHIKGAIAGSPAIECGLSGRIASMGRPTMSLPATRYTFYEPPLRTRYGPRATDLMRTFRRRRNSSVRHWKN